MENKIVDVENVRTKELVIQEIKIIREEVYRTTIIGAVRIGEKLKEIKELVGHGKWLDYIEENLRYGERNVQHFIKIADKYGDENSKFGELLSNPNICTDLSFSKALKLLTVEENDIEEFIENVKVEDISTKELEAEVKKYKEEKVKADKKLEKLEGDNKILKEKNKEAKKTQEAIDKLEKEIKALEQKNDSIKKSTEKEVSSQLEKEIKKLKDEVGLKTTELEVEKRKAKNNADSTLVEFKVLANLIQDNLIAANEIIEKIANEDPDKAGKMKEAIKNIFEEAI